MPKRRSSRQKTCVKKRKRGGQPLVIRFWAKVAFPLTSEGIPTDDPDQCWHWLGYIGKNNGYGVGYGQIRGQDGEGLLKAHRVSYLIAHGDIPDGWDVCHACDNTICVNPNHLFAAPHRTNMHDYIKKFGGLGRPKTLVSLDQLVLFRECGREPFDSAETGAGEPATAARDYDVDESEIAV